MAETNPDPSTSSPGRYHGPVAAKFPLFVSQDGGDVRVRDKAASFPQFLYMQHVGGEEPVMQRVGEVVAYYHIADHYKWALTQLFDVVGVERVILMEGEVPEPPPPHTALERGRHTFEVQVYTGGVYGSIRVFAGIFGYIRICTGVFGRIGTGV